ncbi:MAG TPA: TOBE domain-containing protein [Streptosporangiaceae bacterium]
MHVPALLGIPVLGVPVLGAVLVLVRTHHAYELATQVAGRATDRPAGVARAGQGKIATGELTACPDKRRTEDSMRLSARNKINATVTGIAKGEATANVSLDAGGIRLVASITVEAAEELGLAEGSQVVAIVKASDVILGVAE